VVEFHCPIHPAGESNAVVIFVSCRNPPVAMESTVVTFGDCLPALKVTFPDTHGDGDGDQLMPSIL
jgi:hypothetical protein